MPLLLLSELTKESANKEIWFGCWSSWLTYIEADDNHSDVLGNL